MTSVPLWWPIIALMLLVTASVVAYRLGVASMRPAVTALSAQVQAREEITSSVQPLREAMSSLQTRVDEAERSRVASLSRLSEQVLGMERQVTSATGEVRAEAERIARALSRTHHQGTWGEMQLRRVVEASGMLPHVHFQEQVSLAGGSARPDMIVDLGDDRCVVVDAKVSLDALLDANLTPDEQANAHAAAIGDHLTRLASKQYWKAAGSPEFVIMFLPAEHMLGVALQVRPDLLQAAFDKKVVLATPTTLLATLRSVSWAWQQAEMAGQAREVLAAGQLVHERLLTLSGHLGRLGKDLGDAVSGYNQFVASLESRVLPASRRLSSLVAADEQVVVVEPIDIRPRGYVTEDTG